MSSRPEFPTPQHTRAADAIVDFAIRLPVRAVLLVNSCARGVATPQSDLDFALLIDPASTAADRRAFEESWRVNYEGQSVFRELERLGRFVCVHLDFFDGQWTPERWDDGGGPDAFEIEIGNRVAYATPLWETRDSFSALQARWLPYYEEDLRLERLRMVRDACLLNLDRLASGVGRQLYFYAFDRLYHAFQEFLQAVFLAHRVYPLAYNKWIREQVEQLLRLPALYSELPPVLEINRLESRELLDKADRIRRLLDTWAVLPKSN